MCPLVSTTTRSLRPHRESVLINSSYFSRTEEGCREQIPPSLNSKEKNSQEVFKSLKNSGKHRTAFKNTQ